MMAKRTLTLFILLAVLMSGCSRSGEKINVLEGPGPANTSRLIGFGRLCGGTAEAFLSGPSSLLVSEKTGDKRDFYSADPASGSRKLLFSLPPGDDASVEISGDGEKLLCGNFLYDLPDGSLRMLPEAAGGGNPGPERIPAPAPFSFSGGNEALLTDPYYYIKKFSITAGSRSDGAAAAIPAAFLKLGDKSSAAPFNGFSGLELPQLDYIKSSRMLINQLKYLFIGAKTASGETPLYALDFFEKKFILLDENVRSFTLAPDGRALAYISVRAGQDDRLMASDTSGGGRRELMVLEYLSGIEWSPNGGWIAWSGGRKDRCDVGIIKEDGTSSEQLTNAMYAGPRLAWSAEGGRLAFTSQAAGKSPETYIVTLAGTDQPEAAAQPAPDPARTRLSEQLLEMLRKETLLTLKSGKL